jgi:hypothetical protein
MAFSSTINTVHAVMHRHCCEAMITHFDWCGLSYGTSHLLYCDRAILDLVLSLERFGKSRVSDMIDMNGGRGSKVSFDLKRWSLNLFCILLCAAIIKDDVEVPRELAENNDHNIRRAEVVGSNQQKGEKGDLPWKLVLASSWAFHAIHQQ